MSYRKYTQSKYEVPLGSAQSVLPAPDHASLDGDLVSTHNIYLAMIHLAQNRLCAKYSATGSSLPSIMTATGFAPARNVIITTYETFFR